LQIITSCILARKIRYAKIISEMANEFQKQQLLIHWLITVVSVQHVR